MKDREAMSDSDEIDRWCDAYEAVWASGNQPDLHQWMAGHSVGSEALIELLRVDVAYRRKAVPDFDVGGYLNEFGVTPAELETSDLTATDLTATDLTATDLLRTQVATSLQQKRFRVSDRIGRFQIQHEIGRGGFGCVYLAHDDRLNRKVALKVPRTLLDSESKDRFMREAEAAAALDHLGIVPVYEAGDWDGECYIASAFCEGDNLSQWLKENGSADQQTAATIVRCLAEAMQHAHNRGVVHRDLKPANIMLVPLEPSLQSHSLPFVPRITDFGLAKLVECSVEDTNSSVLLGTPCYMAPEQFLADADRSMKSADIYALGVVLYELLTGRRPHEGKTVVEVMDAVRLGKLKTVSAFRPDVAADLETICLKCLSHNPLDRYETCADIAEDLSSYLLGKPIIACRPTRRERARVWAENSARRTEAGKSSIAIGLIIPGWIALGMFCAWKDGLDISVFRQVIPQALLLIPITLWPLAWTGLKLQHGRRFWAWLGLGYCCVGLALVIPPLFGVIPIFRDFYTKYPGARVAAYSALTMIYAVQAIQYAIVLYFHRPPKR